MNEREIKSCGCMCDVRCAMSEWRGCYREGWQGEIVPEAFSHPAKFSRSLIRRIYEHVIEQGWIAPGQAMMDPFGGVALGALDTSRFGLAMGRRGTGAEVCGYRKAEHRPLE